MKYEVWLNARHPKTLESVATVRVFAHDDRLKAESICEHAAEDFAPIANLLRIWQPGAVVNSEVRPGPSTSRMAGLRCGVDSATVPTDESSIAFMFGDKK